MSCRGASSVPSSPYVWEHVDQFVALGHLILPDGSPNACFERVKKVVWKSFFANAGNKRLASASLTQKLVLMNRSTKPLWQYRCPRWPPSKGLLKSEARLQNKMVATLQRLRPSEGETVAFFIARRNRSAARLSKQNGSWADGHIRLCNSWYEHLLRPANCNSYASALLRFQDAYGYRGGENC